MPVLLYRMRKGTGCVHSPKVRPLRENTQLVPLILCKILHSDFSDQNDQTGDH